MQKHELKREHAGNAEMGSITPTCSCGWRGRTEYTYNDYCHTNVKEQEGDHIRTAVASNAGLGFPPILDACCGGRQFWFDKENPNVLFADCRVMPPKVVGSGKDARTRKCIPDIVHDFRDMEYPDETFQMVVFDPPHLFLGENSFMAQSYGRLDKETWRNDLSRGFGECFRVLRSGGVLIFKWNECDVPLAEILKCTPNKPLFGHPSGKAQKTHWCAFWKPNVELAGGCKPSA